MFPNKLELASRKNVKIVNISMFKPRAVTAGLRNTPRFRTKARVFLLFSSYPSSKSTVRGQSNIQSNYSQSIDGLPFRQFSG